MNPFPERERNGALVLEAGMSETRASYAVGDPGDEQSARRLRHARTWAASPDGQATIRAALADAAAAGAGLDQARRVAWRAMPVRFTRTTTAMRPSPEEMAAAIREFAAARATTDTRRIAQSQHRLAELAARLPRGQP